MKILNEVRGNYRRYILMLCDIVFFWVINGAFYILSVNGHLSNSAAVSDPWIFLMNSLTMLVCLLVSRSLFGIYRTVWRYTSTRSYFNLILSDMVGCAAALICMVFSTRYRGLWHCALVVSLTAHASLAARLCYRLWYKPNLLSDAP